ncbi:MAG: ISAzo13 family transposase, partial [Bacteroidota bacterium]|nr:ISAzo13 family transposase [Bacteroidota bacterium]
MNYKLSSLNNTANLTPSVKEIFKRTAKNLTGYKRRIFEAEITNEFYGGNARKAEYELNWGRATISQGIKELSSGFECVGNYANCGNIKIEEKIPGITQDIQAIVEPHCQVDPQFKNAIIYTRITAKAVREALIENGYSDKELPTSRTIHNMLNRMGYSLKKVEKTRPLKKIPEVDEIFNNVHEANKNADNDPESLRISIDSKATVKIGKLSRGGKSRDKEAQEAHDHDTNFDSTLKPFGILDVLTGLLTIVFGNSSETSDFIVDSLLVWWHANKQLYPHIKELVINLDNGPQSNSNRTQFIKRITEFADETGLRIHLVYYPPYHSKYNPIERCWGALENHWNGTILDSVEKTMKWAETMTWKGINPAIKLIDKVYQKGISLTKKEMEKYADRFMKST